jgi:putative transposase
MPDYRRNRVAGGSCFFTVNLLERNGSAPVTHIDVPREAIRKVRASRPFPSDAWVV